MNTLNRIIVLALLAVATVLCCVLLAGARWVIPVLVDQLGLLSNFIESAPLGQVVAPGIILACVSSVVLALLIVIELYRPRAKFVHVEKASGGEVQVSIASIVDRLRHEVEALPGVLRTKPHVSGGREGVAIHLQVDIVAGLDVPAQAAQIVETAQQVVEEKMGLKMARVPKVSLCTVAYPAMLGPGDRAGVGKRRKSRGSTTRANPKKSSFGLSEE
jgi:hypothetical protein